MLRRILCLFCAVLVLMAGTVPAVSEAAADGNSSYDFDLTFYLNADSFPELLRTRADGYAALINSLGLRGNISWSTQTNSMDLEATMYFTDNPSLTYPFRIYGTKQRVFITSPLINNEIILLNMAALMEFAIKAKNTLGIPLSYLALLFPYTTESAFDGLIRSWEKVIGSFSKSGKVSVKKFSELSGLWTEELLNNARLQFWISGVADGSDSPSAVEIEMNNLPQYYQRITNNKPVSVSVARDSETWKNAAGDTLFSKVQSGDSASTVLSLPASENGYVPYFSLTSQSGSQSFGFDAAASVRRNPSVVSDAGNGYDEEEYGSDWDASSDEFPELLLDFRASGSGLPLSLPADAAFSFSVSVRGALYPNYSFFIDGETKQDGAITLSLLKPYSQDSVPVAIFRYAGTVLPAAEPKVVPDYFRAGLEDAYNVFSFNEQKLSAFTAKVLPSLIRSVFSFVASAPTSACQSFLDDLTDSGILDMLLD